MGKNWIDCQDGMIGRNAAVFEVELYHKSTSVAVGAPADLAIFAVEEGEYTFMDNDGNTLQGNSLIKPYCTILGDDVYWK